MAQVVRYVIQVDNSGALAALREGEAAAVSMENSIKNIAGAFGVGLGLHAVVDGVKEAVKEYAEYEQIMMRIKNVSESVTEGLKNQQFILGEAEKFKIPIMQTANAYGEFLTMIRGSGLAAAEVRKLHDEILLISKVTALPTGQMDAAVRNLGKLLEEGKLEGRHLRPLSYQLSGLMPYIANELGMKSGELSALITKGIGKVNDGKGIDSSVLLAAVDKYAEALKGKLPEALNTTQSALAELNNEWFKFKTDLASELRPEIMELIHYLRDSAAWLKENKEDVIGMGKAIAEIVKIYTYYKIIVTGLNYANGIYQAFMLGYVGLAGKQAAAIGGVTAAYGAQTAATHAATAAIYEEVEAFTVLNTEMSSILSQMFMFNTAAGLGTFTPAGYIVGQGRFLGAGERGLATTGGGIWTKGAGAAGKTAIEIEEAEIVGAGGAALGGGAAAAGFTFAEGALIVALGAATLLALDKILSPKKGGGVNLGYDDDFKNPLRGHMENRKTPYYGFVDIVDKQGKVIGRDTAFNYERVFVPDTVKSAFDSVRDSTSDYLRKMFPETFKNSTAPKKSNAGKYGITPPTDKITGQRIITYNINIKEINGQKDVTIQGAAGEAGQIKNIADQIAQALLSVTNDSQLQQE